MYSHTRGKYATALHKGGGIGCFGFWFCHLPSHRVNFFSQGFARRGNPSNPATGVRAASIFPTFCPSRFCLGSVQNLSWAPLQHPSPSQYRGFRGGWRPFFLPFGKRGLRCRASEWDAASRHCHWSVQLSRICSICQSLPQPNK